MKRGFTMIELIFVIVIIGILAVIAIPKLSATRDDAKLVTELQNLSTCINDLGGSYTATGAVDNPSNVASCTQLKCFTVTRNGNGQDGKVNIKNSGADASKDYCKNTNNGAWKKAYDKKIVNSKNANATTVKTFGGSKVQL